MTMTPDEAVTLLGVSSTASKDEIRKKYQELYSDLQIRLTNAPTPQLRKVYQRNLQELRQACEVLAPGVVVDGAHDLPAAQPTLGDTPSMARALPRQSTRPGAGGPAGAAAVQAGLPRSATIMAMIAILLLGAASYFGFSWVKAEEEVVRRQSLVSKLQAETEVLALRAKAVENGRFQACNKSSQAARITWLGASYWDGQKFRSFNSSLCTDDRGESPVWEVRAGAARKIELERRECGWDGSVLFFAMTVQLADGSEYQVAGNWNEVKDNCARVAVD